MSMLRAAIAKRRAAAGGNNITLGVNATGQGSSSTNTATTGAVTTTAGSYFIIVVSCFGSTAPSISVSDNKSNTYSPIASNLRNGTDGITMRVFISTSTNGGSGHTFSCNVGGSNNYASITAVEVKGTTGVVDGTPVGATAAGTSYNSGNLTTTNANDAVFGAGMVDTNTYPQNMTASTLGLIVSNPCTANNVGSALSYELETAVVTKSAQFSGAPNATYGGALVFALKST